MPTPILTHNFPVTASYFPTMERPVRLVARNLKISQDLAPHSHPCGQITYTPQGMLQVIAEGTVWFVPPMRAIWIPPDTVHEVRLLTESNLRAIHIHQDFSPLSKKHCLVLEVSSLLRELIFSLEYTESGSIREQHLVQVILDELIAAKPLPIYLPMPKDKRLKNLCEILLTHPASNETLKTLANKVGASSRTLTRLFEQELHMSFGDWRQQMRLARAYPLIANGTPLSQVASELGYASQSAFSAMFKKTFGVSPSSFFRQAE
ncbi:AraC family transcriptional regulator [Undibacterium sp. RuRC25W]|uniref:AraC family transcriptional regulator n=1 Tax=Undibacterium sp. RuRC25W TaxID=3413047 RepID=UPI003BEFEAF4